MTEQQPLPDARSVAKPTVAKSSPLPKIAVTVVAVALLFVHLLVPGAKLDPVALGLAALAVLPWLSSFIQSAELPGGWKVEFRKIQEEQTRQQDDVKALKFLVAGFLTGDELKHLGRLAGEEPFEVKVDGTTKFFRQELDRLAKLGLIARHEGKGLRSLLKDDGNHRDAREHFYVTETGREYLRLRGGQGDGG